MKIFTPLFLAASCVVYAQVGGPSLGLVPDSGSVRGLFGIPAAGAVGNLLDHDQSLGLIEISPTQNFALATAAGTGQVFVLTLATSGAALQSTPLAGANASPDRIVFAPDGNSAALWYSASGQVQVVNGFSQTIAVRDVDVSSLGSAPLAMAVSDDGQWFAGAWTQGVYVIGIGGQPILMPADGPAQALCFFHGKSDIAILTSDQVTTVTDIGGKAAVALIWAKPPDAPPNDQTAIGFAASADNTLLTVTGSLGGVETLNLSTNSSSYVTCGCTPTGLDAMGGALYRLTGISASAVKLYDAATGNVWSVPLQTTRLRRAVIRDGDPPDLPPPGIFPSQKLQAGASQK